METKVQHKDNKLLYLIEDDDEFARKLVRKLTSAGFEVRRLRDIRQLESLVSEEMPDAILADMAFEQGEFPGGHIFTALRRRLTRFPPLIFISTASDIQARLAALDAGAVRYFTKPLDVDKLIGTVNMLTASVVKEDYKVVLIQNNERELESCTQWLERSGIQVKGLTNPLACLEVLQAFDPDLLITDIDMPDCAGPELARLIRQDDHYALMPILLLTTEPGGGLDSLTKPVQPEPFVKTVTERIQQARQVRILNRNLESALRDNQYRKRALDEHAILSTTDVTGKIISVNDKFCQISGYSSQELIGENHRILKSGRHTKAFYEELWKTISSGKVWHGVICNRRKSGEEYWVESTIVPVLDDKALPYQYVSIRTDITTSRSNEERLQRSQEFANIGTWDWDIRSGGLYWSDRIAPLFGYTQGELETSYENFLNAVHPEDRQLVSDAVTDCVEKGINYNIEHRIVWPDGSVRWMSERGDVVRDEHGAPQHMLGVVQDITDKKQAEQHLADILQQNQLLLESVGEGIYGIDTSGNLTFANPAACRILGYEIDELIGRNTHALFHHSYADGSPYPVEHCPITAVFKTRQMRRADDEVFWCKDGSRIPIEYTSTPIIQNDNLVGVVVTFRDITERKEAERQITRAKEEAEKANLAKSEFLSSMSHELRTPLNAVIGFSQLLQTDDGTLSEDQRDSVDEIIKASKHLLQLINEVLDLARIESGRVELSMEAVTLGDVIRESLSLISPLAQSRELIIHIKVNESDTAVDAIEDVSINVHADHVRLKQVLLNLLSNAVKYSHEQGKIILATEELDDGYVRVSVRDNGPGLSENKKQRLFQAFDRLGVEHSDIEGTGIGLVITKNIVELMGGRIGFESEFGKGSRFWIDIPRVQPSVPAGELELDINGTTQDAHSHQQASGQRNQDKYKILYIEDNPANLRLVSQIMTRRSDVDLISAHEPFLGLELASQHQPDLILLDINLPGINGFEVLKHIRSRDETLHIPVIAISANAMPSDIEKGKAAGFDQYVTKPINIKDLLTAVDDSLSCWEVNERN